MFKIIKLLAIFFLLLVGMSCAKNISNKRGNYYWDTHPASRMYFTAEGWYSTEQERIWICLRRLEKDRVGNSDDFVLLCLEKGNIRAGSEYRLNHGIIIKTIYYEYPSCSIIELKTLLSNSLYCKQADQTLEIVYNGPTNDKVNCGDGCNHKWLRCRVTLQKNKEEIKRILSRLSPPLKEEEEIEAQEIVDCFQPIMNE